MHRRPVNHPPAFSPLLARIAPYVGRRVDSTETLNKCLRMRLLAMHWCHPYKGDLPAFALFSFVLAAFMHSLSADFPLMKVVAAVFLGVYGMCITGYALLATVGALILPVPQEEDLQKLAITDRARAYLSLPSVASREKIMADLFVLKEEAQRLKVARQKALARERLRVQVESRKENGTGVRFSSSRKARAPAMKKAGPGQEGGDGAPR